MFNLLKQGKRIYNVDESWIDQLNFSRQHWKPTRYATEGMKPVSPRVSLIACVGTDGTALYSLTQINTDSKVFCLYLTELVKKLSAADKDWRDNSVLLLDNASYHVSPETLSYLAWLKVEVIFSGPCKYRISSTL